jgi:hypothetical protein
VFDRVIRAVFMEADHHHEQASVGVANRLRRIPLALYLCSGDDVAMLAAATRPRLIKLLNWTTSWSLHGLVLTVPWWKTSMA